MEGHETEQAATGRGSEQSAPKMGRPNNHLVAVLDTGEGASRAMQALMAGGFLESEIHLSSGEAAANALRADTGHSGLVDWAIRLAERLGLTDDDMEVKARYEQALRDGHTLLAVEAPSDARQARAVEILREHGAHTVNFIGRFSRTEIRPPGAHEGHV